MAAPAAVTASVASSRPVPQPEQLAGKLRTLLRSRLSVCSTVSAGLRAIISAATPATCGVAIEVPW